MPRQARLDSPGTLHHVIVRGIEKKEIVSDKYDRADFVKRMGALAQETGTSIYAWSLMTNHAHILLKSGPLGLSKYMRRFLTGYAIAYNIRHKRHGHLFQNRYKSIVCDEDAYFQELVRYIHLNPLRAKIVKDMSALDRYFWCGHGVIMGTKRREWQDRNYVLAWFGTKESEAKRTYREYVKDGIEQGRREDLVGGGLIRTLGGWSQVLSLRRSKEKVLSDERILGSGEFVERILEEAENEVKYQVSTNERRIKAEKKIQEICRKEGLNKEELQGGSRRGRISRIRAQLAIELTERYGLSLAEAGRQLGVSTSAISRIFMRNKGKVS
ncbi:MAG: transposase [Desulfobacteraceae bacterium]